MLFRSGLEEAVARGKAYEAAGVDALFFTGLTTREELQAIAGAVMLSLMIGASRPMLGVHWPTDVLAGWLFGLTWVGVAWSLSRRARSAG